MLVSGSPPASQSGAGRGDAAAFATPYASKQIPKPELLKRRTIISRTSPLDAHVSALRRRRRGAAKVACTSGNGSAPDYISAQDVDFLKKTAGIAGGSVGLTQPHPYAGCTLVGPDGQFLTQAFQRAQGTTSAEVQAVRLAGEAAHGSTAYLNLESGDCHGDVAAIKALIQGGVKRVVVGVKHPLDHIRGKAIRALTSRGIAVASLEETPAAHNAEHLIEGALTSCLEANEALFHRAHAKRPFSILKYAMTLDGKIAATTGHSAWVSTSIARQEVFKMRAASDAVIVGGQTVRRDNPRLTTRMESGHAPVRILMSRTLELPEDANLWDIDVAPTIVMTQGGARRNFQDMLRSKGVEVVEFDFLTPGNVADYCYERGFMQCFWECGGELAAPSLAQNVIHKVMAFVAPKIIGGVGAPTPCGDLGFVQMTQAVPIVGTSFRQVGPDIMIEGYLPASGGLKAVHDALNSLEERTKPPSKEMSGYVPPMISHASRQKSERQSEMSIGFYKAWDKWGCLSNFSPHPITMPDGKGPAGRAALAGESSAREWASVEHYYQAQKFAGVENDEAKALIEEIFNAESPEEAARLGRSNARAKPHLVSLDWGERQLDVMREALVAKFSLHDGPREMLLATGKEEGMLAEMSPHDFFWGTGADGSGENRLGKLLTELREEFLAGEAVEESLLMAM